MVVVLTDKNSMKRLPFQRRFNKSLRSGEKVLTTRTRAYGKPGDVLLSPVGPVELLHVERVSLGFIAEVLYKQEGFSGPDEFLLVWRDLHPVKRFDLKEKVVLHHFRMLQPGDPRWLVGWGE